MAAAAATQQQQMIRPGSRALKPGLLYTFFPRKNKLTACLNPVASWARCISMAAAFKRARAAGGCLRLSRPVNIRQGNFYKSSMMSITRLGGGGYRFADEHADLMKRTKHWINNEACGYWKKWQIYVLTYRYYSDKKKWCTHHWAGLLVKLSTSSPLMPKSLN